MIQLPFPVSAMESDNDKINAEHNSQTKIIIQGQKAVKDNSGDDKNHQSS